MPDTLDVHRAEAIAKVRRLESAGDLLEAHERAMSALKRWPDDPTLRYRAVLTLARAGTLDHALALYDELRLGTVESEDERALAARLLKDRALLAGGEQRRESLGRSAILYAEAHAFGRGGFSAINAATLFFLAGDGAQSSSWQRRAVAACAAVSPETTIDRYWRAATLAEAALLTGDEAGTACHLAEATALPRDVAAWASTRRQLALILAAQGRDEAILAPLRLPAAVHYLGHMIAPPGAAGRFPAGREAEIAAAIAERLDRCDAGFLCGSLACGADILFAEAGLRRGAELHVVLPFKRADFVRLSVARGGPGWDERFATCLARATSVTWATDAGHDGDDALFAYAARIAMGQAILTARRVGGVARQIAVWDGQPAAGAAGTAVDVATWRALGRETDVIALPAQAPLPQRATSPAGMRRTNRAILCGDIEGFSRLTDDQVPLFERQVLGAVAEAVAPYAASLRYRNSWGDAIYLAFDDLVVAAEAALAIQDCLTASCGFASGLPTGLRLRLAGHFGPTYDGYDPVRREPSVIGAHVTRAARIEPVTPGGAVYVTEPFAAALALTPITGIALSYVGRKTLPKGYGELRLYRLDRRP